MLAKQDKSLSKADKPMNDAVRAQSLLHGAWPDLTHDGKGRVQAALYDAWRYLKPRVEPYIDREYTLRRVRSIHEAKARRIDGAEFEALKQAQIEEARREYKQLQTRLQALEATLAMADQAPNGAAVAAYRAMSDGLGRMDRSRAGDAR